jgi:hypothetical protein
VVGRKPVKVIHRGLLFLGRHGPTSRPLCTSAKE